MFSNIGEGQTQTVWRRANNAAEVFPEHSVFLVGYTNAILREAVGNASGPDWKSFGMVCALSKIHWIANFSNPRHCDEKSTYVIIDRVASIAIIKDQRFSLLQFSPKMTKERALTIVFHHPCWRSLLISAARNLKIFLRANVIKVGLKHPSIWCRTAGIRRNFLISAGKTPRDRRVE